MRAERAYRQDAAFLANKQRFGWLDELVFVTSEIGIGDALAVAMSDEITAYSHLAGFNLEYSDITNDPLSDRVRIFGMSGLLAQPLYTFGQMMTVVGYQIERCVPAKRRDRRSCWGPGNCIRR